MEHKLTKEEYAQKMKEKRLILFDMANQQLSKTTSSNELYLNYLILLFHELLKLLKQLDLEKVSYLMIKIVR